ncbi:putative GlcNAc transferase [Listeria weihenstephanensis FSL R9-0317]|uniref:Glycosyl transferase family 1 n=1 Tax=Listeria weihenstephanensis TaxID=1006155 RepID=A0A1S7FY98_9LIST|nr:glycosyltransferase family 4 protein [Listeria weihenstephanensis]AQY52345.1 glycosyl transferase family 1 [Listeria weihenstephanensis]EUJ38253.1 putative GlcNAc transferase [Listeria weihenstephanensis FSL R9-0317]
MKILVIANMFPSKAYPSYGIFVKKHVDILEKAASSLDTITMQKEVSKGKKLWRYIQFYFQIFFTLLFKKYDLVYLHYASHSALPVLGSKYLKRRINLTVNLHGSDVFPETPIQERLQKWVVRLLKQANHVVVPSQYFKEVVIDRYNIHSENILISPSGGVNRTLFAPQETDKNSDVFQVGYVGRIDVDKGWDDAIRGFNEFKLQSSRPAQLIMVGNGKENKQKEALIQELGLEEDVRCYDLLPQEALVALYNEMDVFVFPSRREGESLGLVGIEALACGIPVIGSQIAGIKGYLVEGENGYFTEAGNPYSIAEKLLEFHANSEEEKQTLKKNAFHSASPYDQVQVEEDMLGILATLIK